MNRSEFVKKFITHYFCIYTGTMFGTLIFCLIFQPDAEFSLSYFAWMMLFSLIGDLPLLVFYSKKELTHRQMNQRFLLHFILLEFVLLIAAYFLDMYQTPGQGFVFMLIVLGVYLMVRYTNYLMDCHTADVVNQRLREIANEHEREGI